MKKGKSTVIPPRVGDGPCFPPGTPCIYCGGEVGGKPKWLVYPMCGSCQYKYDEKKYQFED